MKSRLAARQMPRESSSPFADIGQVLGGKPSVVEEKLGIDISINLDIIRPMDLLEIFKALSNPVRLQILKGLKDPVNNFPAQDEGDVFTVGVCVSSIQEGVGLSQSTVSGYLATLQRVGLVEVRRIGQWTYYKRNEATISALAELIGKDL